MALNARRDRKPPAHIFLPVFALFGTATLDATTYQYRLTLESHGDLAALGSFR